MSRRYELAEEQFALIGDLLPSGGKRGGQWKNHRTVLNGIFWMLHTGAQWRELPERYGTRSTVHDRLTLWRKDGMLDRILERLRLRLDEQGRIETGLWLIDAINIRASRAAAGGREKKEEGEPDDHALGRSRGGYGSKVHLIVDGNGVPLGAKVTPDQAHESKHLEEVLESVTLKRSRGQPRRRPRRLAGDKGYSYPRIRCYLRRRGIRAIIPRRANQRASSRPFERRAIAAGT